MTVSTTTSTAQFAPNGVTINFPFAFRFFAATDLKVFWQKPDGTIQLLVLNSNYTVQGVGNDAGGSITTIGTPLPNGLLVVSRIMVATQLTSFRNQGEFFAEIHEDAFDKLVMLVQQTIDGQGRGLTAPVADPLDISLVLPGAVARSDKLLAFDGDGQPIVSNLTLAQLEQQPALALESAAQAAASAQAADESETAAGQSAGQSADAAVAAAASAASITGAAVPLFSVMWWPGLRSAIPAGYGPGDGQTLSRALFPDAAAGVLAGNMPTAGDATWLSTPTERGKYTSGDGTTTFRVPDYNGKFAGSLGAIFLRGDGAMSAGTAGTIQQDAFQGHKFGVLQSGSSAGSTNLTRLGAGTGVLDPSLVSGPVTDGVNGAPRFGLETRPLNVTGCWVIKLFGAVTNQGAADAALLATQVAALSSRITALEFGYTSSNQTWVIGGTVTQNHGLVTRPARTAVEAECVTADAGYTVGAVIDLGASQCLVSGANNFGFTTEISATQMIVNIAAQGLAVTNKSTRAVVAMTPASWRLRLKAGKS